MAKRFNQKPVVTGVTRFTRAPMAEVEYSRMTANPIHTTSFNAGDIVPVLYEEVLPHDTFSIDANFVIRQMTALFPTMDNMECDLYAYFVPNRIINESWKNIQGENTSSFWTAPEISLAPLYVKSMPVLVPVGSVADYYGFPTQSPIPANVLQACNDLKFRGYLSIYNHFFRDENYQPPIPFSTLNVYNGFFEPVGTLTTDMIIPSETPSDGSSPAGAIQKAIYGEGSTTIGSNGVRGILTAWSALDKPLKANKLHDFITSGLPSPQKGSEVFIGLGDTAPLIAGDSINELGSALQFGLKGQTNGNGIDSPSSLYHAVFDGQGGGKFNLVEGSSASNVATSVYVNGTNLLTDLSKATGISINDLRTAVATQQVYETLARGGSRYLETIRSFFEIETENPFSDIPTELGHIRRGLDLYQVAQTSPSQSGSTPQANLSAFGYTSTGGSLFNRTFLEHGYVHILAVVRHRNTYGTYFAPDNFRMSTLDFYLPQFANIGEQPIRKAVLNPFKTDSLEKVIAYQEAWWEYRYEPNRVSGLMRPGIPGSLDMWNYADDFDLNFEVVTGSWLQSNSEEVLNRTIAVTSSLEPQFKGIFSFKVDKQRPMPTYSVPGLDTI